MLLWRGLSAAIACASSPSRDSHTVFYETAGRCQCDRHSVFLLTFITRRVESPAVLPAAYKPVLVLRSVTTPSSRMGQASCRRGSRGLSVFYSRYVWHPFLSAAHLMIRGKRRSLERDASMHQDSIRAHSPRTGSTGCVSHTPVYAAARWSRPESNTVPSRHNA